MLETLSRKVLAHYKSMEEMYAFRHGEGNPLTPLLDEFDRTHPGLDVWALKKAQYAILSENMDTLIFDESPFYFVNNMCFRDGKAIMSAGGWLQNRNRHLFRDANPEVYDRFYAQRRLGLYLCCGPYADELHFCYPVGHVVERGLKGAYEKVQQAKAGANDEEMKFLDCAEAGLLAAKRVAERFAEAARKRRAELTDEKAILNMDRLIAAAEHAPWEPCASFLEGLNTMWFCRNVLGTMDGIGNSHLGRPDLELIGLYRHDLEAGVLTEEEAMDLIRQFIVFGDMSYDKNVTVQSGADHEMELGFVLGGCDSEGRPVCNELTHLFIQAHRDVNAIYPKLHCRICEDSPDEYLEDIARDMVGGRSVIGLSNDKGYIPALLRDGLTIEDARGYVNTGCWSSISAGNESVPGGNYFYMPRVLEQSVYGSEEEFVKEGAAFERLDGARTFEELYRAMLRNLRLVMDFRNGAIEKYGPAAAKVNPLAMTSAFMSGCLESRKDFTQGGCRYNRNTIDPAGFANIVDALLAIRTICFDEKRMSVKEYLDIVRGNWEGHEDLLARVRKCRHFGDFSRESMELAQRLHYDLFEEARRHKNERGGNFSLNYIVYREFMMMAKNIRATPDGRRDGDYYALGIGPTRYHEPDAVTDVLQSAGGLDPELVDVSALDLQLPLGQFDVKRLAMVLRTVTHTGVKHLQINVVSVDELKDAQAHPEEHQDLIVRVCGFSAKFTALCPFFQEEVIKRCMYEK